MKISPIIGVLFWLTAEVWTLFHLTLVWSSLTHIFNWLATF